MKARPLFLYAILAVLFFASIAYGFRKHDINECKYWESIKEDSLYNPTPPMIAQCDHYEINIEK